MGQLLLELLSEEIPARMQARAASDLASLVGQSLTAEGLSFAPPRSLVTPRRLTLVIEALPAATPDVTEQRRGPRVGAPAAAIDGFLKGAGVTLAQCTEEDSGKGRFYVARITRPGRPTSAVLAERLETILASFPWTKSMRWGTESQRWVRPLHSILCLFDGAVVPLRFAALTAGNVTRGHRFLAPASFAVKDAADYAARLGQAFVVLDAGQRQERILSAAEAAAAALGLTLRQDEGLLAEVAGLVEWPVVLAGAFDPAFMVVPDEALITAMRTQQKYFSLLHSDGRLAPHFLVVANLPDAGGAILAGNQRVLRARLSDAKFFWDSDRKQRLEQRLDGLAGRLFYAGLGSLADKAGRIGALAAMIADRIGADARAAGRAALLAKADLSSAMVGEFPELQGIMGRYYARLDGESDAVAEAIGAHYAPQGPGEACPTAKVTVAVALADKIDSLVGFFAVDEKPTGSKDPFALRRAALGVIRLILENGLRLPLAELFHEAHRLYPALPRDATTTGAELLLFFNDRMKTHLKDANIGHDRISAVAGGDDDLFRVQAKARALQHFLATDDGANLLIAYRRASNIARIEGKKDGADYVRIRQVWTPGGTEEEQLRQALQNVDSDRRAAGEDYAAAMAAMAALRAPVDLFFDKVTVNSANRAERRRRLDLVGWVCDMMEQVADFSVIEG